LEVEFGDVIKLVLENTPLPEEEQKGMLINIKNAKTFSENLQG